MVNKIVNFLDSSRRFTIAFSLSVQSKSPWNRRRRFERHQSVGSGPFRAPTRASQRMTVFCYAARVRLSFERFGEFAELTGRDVRTESRLNALEIRGAILCRVAFCAT